MTLSSWRRRAVLIVLAALSCAPDTGTSRRSLEGGRALADCDWPSVGMIDANCTATLIAPTWLLTAAHCPNVAQFRAGSATAGVTRCIRHPLFATNNSFDFMVCEIDPPLATTMVPLLAPCEATALAPGDGRLMAVGTPGVVVGLGQPVMGDKRAVDMEVDSVWYSGPLVCFEDPANLGGARPGDSGGPTFVALADGTFRQVGVHKLGGVGSLVVDAFVPAAFPWIESATGVDLTPCHSGDTWQPGAACVTLPWSLEGGGGTFPACIIGQKAPSPTCVGTADGGGPGGPDSGLDAGPPEDAATDDDTGTVPSDAGGDRDADHASDGAQAGDAAATGLDAAAPGDAGGTADADAGAGGDGGLARDARAPEAVEGGCGCNAPAQPPSGPFALLLVAWLVAWLAPGSSPGSSPGSPPGSRLARRLARTTAPPRRSVSRPARRRGRAPRRTGLVRRSRKPSDRVTATNQAEDGASSSQVYECHRKDGG